MRLSRLLPLFFVMALLVLGCKTRPSGSSGDFYRSLSAPQKASIDVWKGDPYGCKKERDAVNADEVLKIIHGGKLNQDAVIALLGPAEESKTTHGVDYIGYYFDGECLGGKLKPGTVFCVLQCYFDAATHAWQQGSVICG